jgi:hypothetical protein
LAIQSGLTVTFAANTPYRQEYQTFGPFLARWNWPVNTVARKDECNANAIASDQKENSAQFAQLLFALHLCSPFRSCVQKPRDPEAPLYRPHPCIRIGKSGLLQTGTPASLRTEHRLAGWHVHTSCLGPLGEPFAPQLLHRGVECHLGFGRLRRRMAAMASGVCVIRATAREERKTPPAVAKTSTFFFNF